MAKASSTFDLGSTVGFKYKDEEVTWNKRDTIFYALSVGAHLKDRNIIYENDPKFQVFPTFATTLSFKGTETDVFNFASKFANEEKPDGLPKLDANSLVQASQYFELLKPLPAVSKPGFKVQKKIIGAHEAADGVTFDNEIILVGDDGTQYARMIAQAKYNGAKINGVPFSSADYVTFPKGNPITSMGRPTWTTTGPTWETQSAVYRLNGDYNPLHIDPAFGAKAIYGGVILHGLGMWGITARALVEKLSGSDPSALQSITALFIGPIVPGDVLEISIWDLGPAPDGKASYIAFEARNAAGALCLGEGRAYLTIDKSAILPETNPLALSFTGAKSGGPDGVVRPANGPKQVLQTPTGPFVRGLPLFQVLPALFWAPMIVLNLLFVTLSYWATWWWQW